MSGYLHDEIGFAQGPFALWPDECSEGISVALNFSAVVDPTNELLHLLVAEIHLVLHFVADLVVDLSGWHALSHNHFANHWRPALDCEAVVHCERRNAAFAVTLGAVLCKDRCDVVGIGQR